MEYRGTQRVSGARGMGRTWYERVVWGMLAWGTWDGGDVGMVVAVGLSGWGDVGQGRRGGGRKNKGGRGDVGPGMV